MSYTLTEKIWSTVKRNNTPLDIMVEITRRCNLNCCHCYVVKDEQRKELTIEEVTRIIDEIREAGCLFLTLTGGEPLVREDFIEIARYIRNKGLALQIFTNGTLITDGIADEIQKLYPLKIGVSLYGASATVHERITGVTDSYNQTLLAIKLLKERKIPVNIKCTLMRENINEYDKICELAQSLGVDIHIDPIIVPKDDGSLIPIAHRIQDKELEKVIMSEDTNISYHRQGLLSATSITPEFICDAGKTVCSISAYGDVYPCLQLPIKAGNLRESTFSEIWMSSNELLMLRDLKLNDLSLCSTCELRFYCDRCPGLAFLEDSGLLSPSQVACKIAKIRRRYFEPL